MLEAVSQYLRSNCFSFKQKTYLIIPGVDVPRSPSRKYHDQQFYRKYRVLHKIGAGGYGTVFKVQRRADGAEFAAKIVSRCRRTSWCDSREKQVPDEIMLWEGLVHPNILQLEDSYFERNHWIMITEYNKDYIDLFDYINGPYKLSGYEITGILRQIISVCLYLHKQGIDHRDIKDENILYNPTTKQIKLLDFGSACRINTPPTGMIYTNIQGTDIYLPPEFYQRGSYSADSGTVWSIGCLAYVMFNNKPPFVNRDDVKMYDSNIKWSVDVEPVFRDFVEACLDRDMTQRYKLDDLLSYDCFK